jgi:cytochrome oxidase Cu insertion factor (SCO1/SenC/PrrC family)
VYASTGLTEKEMETEEDYLVDHTIFFYLMGPDGVIRDYFGKQMTSDEVSAGILKVMDDEMPKSWIDKLLGN